MLRVERATRSFIRVRAIGFLGTQDYRSFETEFAAELSHRNLPVEMLLDLTGFRGWTPAGFVRDLLWDFGNRKTFSRIAVIGDARWHRWITSLGAPLFRAKLRFFETEEAAKRWLRP